MFPEMASFTTAMQSIAISIDRIEQIASTTMSQVEADASSAAADFRSTPVSVANFGDVPLAAELGTQHHAAHQVFVDTIEGVLQDLRDFQTNLLASARAHQGTDDAAYATLVALGARYAKPDFHAARNWDQGRREHGDELPPAAGPETREAAGGGPGEQSGPAVDDQAPAAPAPAPAAPADPSPGTGF